MPRRRSNSKTSASLSQETNENDNLKAVNEAREFLLLLMEEHESRLGKSVLHTIISNSKSLYAGPSAQDAFAMAYALLERLIQLDKVTTLAPTVDTSLCMRLLLSKDTESGYTPLHWAIYKGELHLILLILRASCLLFDDLDASLREYKCSHRPMVLLFPEEPTQRKRSSSVTNGYEASGQKWYAITQARDNDGVTPGELLLDLQRRRLEKCRLGLYSPKITESVGKNNRTGFDWEVDEQDDQDDLRRNLHQLHLQDPDDSHVQQELECGYEVLTFGKAHHCALGVVAGSDDKHAHRLKPQRVQAFATQDGGRACAIAGSTHHTLVATADGHLYSFGLGKGGRLGTGTENPSSLPQRVPGLKNNPVVAIAAAENHSLCICKSGAVFAWGSNRFGQLGFSSGTSSKKTKSDETGCASPRRIDDLRGIPCIDIAAGSRHSVALTERGEVYVWGDNAAGQLALGRRNGVHRVQRVEALWDSASEPKIVIQVSASEKSTLVLAKPSRIGLPMNSVYQWGHGSDNPSRLQFGPSGAVTRAINPVKIACARYHSAALTSDGHVYTWGLHADALGGSERQRCTSPELVTGMLSSNGGGFAVDLSASDNHTAVVTAEGNLYTWGATDDKNIMGHEGVTWQPKPKRVLGVHRAVKVAVAREHTVILSGTNAPVFKNKNVLNLEDLAASVATRHVDMFNALQVSAVADRFDNKHLVQYSRRFIECNMDGVLNVCQKSVLNHVLTEKVSSVFCIKDASRDSDVHPLMLEMITFTSSRNACLRCDELPNLDAWIGEVVEIKRSGWSPKLKSTVEARPKKKEATDEPSRLDQAQTVIKSLNLTDVPNAEKSMVSIKREIRAIEKKLLQISRLRSRKESGHDLHQEETSKILRERHYESELALLRCAEKEVENKLVTLYEDTRSKNAAKIPVAMKKDNVPKSAVALSDAYRCVQCDVMCTDRVNFEMHLNGRKHRNRMAFLAEQEKETVARSMAQEQLRTQLETQCTPAREVVKSMPSAWKVEKSAATPPKFSLPPPPVPVPATLAPSSTPSLKDIMQQEERSMQLRSKKRTPVTQVARRTNERSRSLADFVAPTKAAVALPSSWASDNFSATRQPILSFHSIQRQEVKKKQVEDKQCGVSGKWFVESRPRAGSFREIEEAAAKEREHLLLVEEQRRIEAQIAAERKTISQRSVEKKKTKRTRQSKPRKRGNGVKVEK